MGAHAPQRNEAESRSRARAQWLAPRRIIVALVGTITGALLVGGLFEVAGLPQFAAPCFVVAMFVPLLACLALLPIGLVALAMWLVVGPIRAWRRCALRGRVALIAGVCLLVAVWSPDSGVGIALFMLSVSTLIVCAVGPMVRRAGWKRRARTSRGHVGWHPDPWRRFESRWWDGAWTERVKRDGAEGLDAPGVDVRSNGSASQSG